MKLNKQTVRILRKADFHDLDALAEASDDHFKEMGISLGQIVMLNKARMELKAEYQAAQRPQREGSENIPWYILENAC